MSRIEVFLPTGDDTTSSSMVQVYKFLSKHSSVLTLVREEHAYVFCPDLTALTNLLVSRHLSLSALSLPLAVIQKTPAPSPPPLWPPELATLTSSSPILASSPHSTEECLVQGKHHGLHCKPRYWIRPEDCRPERWLVSEGDHWYPSKNCVAAF